MSRQFAQSPVPSPFLPILYFLALSLLLTWPLVTHLGSGVTDPIDPLLNTWILAWGQHALLTDPGSLLHANIFHPYPHTLLYSETLLLPGLILLPIAAAFGNPILTHNSLILFGLTTTGYSGYLLGRWLNRGSRRAWLGGLVLGTALIANPYMLSVLPKAQLLQATWLPLALIYLGKMLIHRGGAEGTEKSVLLRALRASAVNILWLAAFLAAQFYSVVYYGLFGFFAVALIGGVGWLLTRYPSARIRLIRLFSLAVAGGLGALLSLPLALPYLRLSQEQGFARTLADAWPFAASLEMWRAPLPQSWLYAWLLPADGLPRVGSYPVESLFPGFGLLALAALGIGLLLRRGPAWGMALLLGTAFFFVLSLGPFWQRVSLQPDFDLRLPYAWLHECLPGFTALRAPARFALLVFLGVGSGAAYGVSRRLGPKAALLVLALLIGESLALPLHQPYRVQTEPDVQAAYAWLAQQPPGVVMELPAYSPTFDQKADRWLEAQLGSVRHWHTTPAGYSGFLPPRHPDLLLLSYQFPRPQVVELFQAMGVTWVVIHRDRLLPGNWEEIEAAIRANGWPRQDFGRLTLVTLPPGPPVEVPARRLHIPTVGQAGGSLTLGLILSVGESATISPNSELGQLSLAWSREGRTVQNQSLRVQPPFVADPLALAPVSVSTPGQPGRYTLTVRGGDGSLLAQAPVDLLPDPAPPEITLLPLQPIAAAITCGEDGPQLGLTLRTVGWFDHPVTLGARLIDEAGDEIARSRVDVAFPPFRPRINLLTEHLYPLPLTELAPELAPGQPLTAQIFAYEWQQAAQRTVPRHWLGDNGEALPILDLPVAVPDQPCG